MLELFGRDRVRANYDSVTPLCATVRFELDSPRFRVILRKFDLVLGHNVCKAIEDYEAGRSGTR